MKRYARSRLKDILSEHNARRAIDWQKPITWSELSFETGIAQSTLARIAYNRSGRVSLRTLENLCDYFQCDIGDLYHLV